MYDPRCTCGPWMGVIPPPPCPVHMPAWQECQCQRYCPCCGAPKQRAAPTQPDVTWERVYIWDDDSTTPVFTTTTGGTE